MKYKLEREFVFPETAKPDSIMCELFCPLYFMEGEAKLYYCDTIGNGSCPFTDGTWKVKEENIKTGTMLEKSNDYIPEHMDPTFVREQAKFNIWWFMEVEDMPIDEELKAVNESIAYQKELFERAEDGTIAEKIAMNNIAALKKERDFLRKLKWVI